MKACEGISSKVSFAIAGAPMKVAKKPSETRSSGGKDYHKERKKDYDLTLF
jgi:hypothetical protein